MRRHEGGDTMDEQQFSDAVERAEEALAAGDFYTWRKAMMTVMSARASDEQWARALGRLRASRQETREQGRLEVGRLEQGRPNRRM